MTDKLRAVLNNSVEWVFQEKHKQKANELRQEVEKAFTEHPKSTGETYLQHLAFTARVSSHLMFVGFSLITHGLFPFLFTRTASKEIESVYFTMRSRIPKPAQQKHSAARNILSFKRPVDTSELVRIGVIGGGFSGTMIVANLVREAKFPCSIEWFEEGDGLCGGVAYGSNDNVHLLNVRANRMGAFPEKPEGFYEWLRSQQGRAAAVMLWPEQEITPTSFVPRILYGAYLKSINEETLRLAKEKSIEIRIAKAKAVDAHIYNQETKQLVVSSLKHGIMKETLVDALVLATGNLPPQEFNFQSGIMHGTYVHEIWNPDKDGIFPNQLNQLPADSEIVIIGTGLTMIDAILTLKKQGFKGIITAISRHGCMPQPHADNIKPYQGWALTAQATAPERALGLLKAMREEVKKAADAGIDWRSVVDSVRDATPQLWEKLTTNEKRKFLRHLFTLWNIHRHRLAPEIHADVKAMIKSGTLKIISGRIYYIGSDEMGTTVAYRKRGTNRVETIRAALVLNCTGPQYDIATSKHTLLRNLRDRELVTVGPLRFGIELNSSGSARGKAQDVIYPIGTLMVGELLECTAVPELREQARNTASMLAAKLAQLYAPSEDNRLFGSWI